MAVMWLVLGVLLLLSAAAIIARMPSVELGPYATRLIALVLSALAYYGASARWPDIFGPLHGPGARVLFYVVPVAAAIAAGYCLWRIVRGWRTEVHGVVTGVLRLVVALALVLLARWCLAR